MLGKSANISGSKVARIKNMLLIAFGQKKMFKNPLVAVLHLAIYVAFVITQIELIEIFIDGYSGHHRLIYHGIEHVSVLRSLYVVGVNTIEVLSVLAFIATIIFLSRRNLLKLPRLNMAELKLFLDEILPASVERTQLDEYIDIEFMKSRVKNGVFDSDYLMNLFTFVMNLLAEWDALHFRERYEMEKTVILHKANTDVSFSKLIRLVLEKSFYYTIDLKNRKEIWNKLLETPQ